MWPYCAIYYNTVFNYRLDCGDRCLQSTFESCKKHEWHLINVIKYMRCLGLQLTVKYSLSLHFHSLTHIVLQQRFRKLEHLSSSNMRMCSLNSRGTLKMYISACLLPKKVHSQQRYPTNWNRSNASLWPVGLRFHSSADSADDAEALRWSGVFPALAPCALQ